MIVGLHLGEEGYPSWETEGVIRGRARQGRTKLGQADISALDTTNLERHILSFTRNQWDQDESFKYVTQMSKLLMDFWKCLAFANQLESMAVLIA